MDPLRIESIVKDYPGKRALDGVSLDVSPGQRLGILGPNGAGKTTLLSIITGSVRPTSGKITLGKADPFRRSKQWRKLLGYLPQSFDFAPGLTGREALLQAALLHGASPGEAKRLASRLLGEFRFDEAVASRAASGYSIGMKQRLAFACALVNEPALLLLDEPTAGLDPIERRLFRESLRDGLSHGQMAILSSHIVGDIEHCCDHVVVMGSGRVLFHGPIRELAMKAEGRIWHSPAGESDLLHWKNEGRLVSARPEGDEFRARVLSDHAPHDRAERTEASLEDGYRSVMMEAGLEAIA